MWRERVLRDGVFKGFENFEETGKAGVELWEWINGNG